MDQAKNILITGGTDGIGLELAKLYQSEGCQVVVTGRRNAAEAGQVLGENISYIKADQSSPQAAAGAIIEGLEAFGWTRCNIAFLNAGCGKIGNPIEESPNHIRTMIDVNLSATILISQALYPLLQAASPDRGKLILIGSTSHRGAKNFASYAAVKAGLHGFARSLREEWRGRVDVKIIHPGPTATAMHEKAGFDPGWMRKLFLKPDAMARLIRRQAANNRSPVSIGFMAKIQDGFASARGSSK